MKSSLYAAYITELIYSSGYLWSSGKFHTQESKGSSG